MPYTSSSQPEPLRLPFNGRSTRTRRSSRDGAVNASERAATQCIRMLTAYKEAGSLTDAEMSERLGIQRSSVIPRRRELMHRGLVQELGQRKNPATNIINTTFGLAE